MKKYGMMNGQDYIHLIELKKYRIKKKLTILLIVGFFYFKVRKE
jgi:hypothetical protein